MNKLFEKIDNSWKVIRVLLSMLVFAGLLVFLVKEFMPSHDTYGSIYVDSPEVYTRERLVNDRFLQDAWLNKWLDLKSGHTEFVGNKSYLDVLNFIKASIGETDKNKVAEPPERSTQSSAASLSTGDVFVDMVDFRDRVRNYKIENQLDDRHDLKGNTLYRLKFDATIVPGNSTRALARIKVKLMQPECIEESNDTSQEDSQPERESRLREVYKRWLSNLQARLNRIHREQKQVYFNNKFKEEDYAALRDYFKLYYDIRVNEVTECSKLGGGDSSVEAENEKSEQKKSHPDHSIQRTCIRSIVRQQLEKEQSDFITYGEYIQNKENKTDDSPISKESTKSVVSDVVPRGEYKSVIQSTPVTELKIKESLETHLNSFMASKTLRLVFGIRVPMSTIIEKPFPGIPQLRPITKVTFLGHQPQRAGYQVFSVDERTVEIPAINKEMIDRESFEELSKFSNNYAEQSGEEDNKTTPGKDFEAIKLFSGEKYDDFVQLDNTKSPDPATLQNFYILKDDDNWLRRTESYPVNRLVFNEIKSWPGTYVAKADIGLQKFEQYARTQTTTYAYAVTPKMRSENQFSSFQRATEAKGGTLSWLKDISVQAHLARSMAISTVNRKGTTVGFAEETGKSEAVFGWIIGPRISTADSREKIHTPVQQSLSALVSLPSWWNQARLTVTTDWIDPDSTIRNEKGDEIKNDKGKSGKDMSDEKRGILYQLDLPPNYENLEIDILKLQGLGPEVMESHLDPIRLTACKPGAIVIPGGRLWRSTVVTMGYQTADQISVLPNMKGIIAIFNTVKNQMSVAEAKQAKKDENNSNGFEISRTVRVWTSQGMVALPEPARIGIPNSWHEKCPVETSNNNGE